MPSTEIRPFATGRSRAGHATRERTHRRRTAGRHPFRSTPSMSQLEREPGRGDRRSLGARAGNARRDRARARVRGRPSAALRRGRARVNECYRNLGEIRWLVFGPQNEGAARRAARAPACVSQRTGRSRATAADMSLPCPCCYGVPDCWPHLRELLVRNGFRHEGQTEVILVADVADLPAGVAVPLAGLDRCAARSAGRGRRRAPRRPPRRRAVGFADLSTDLTTAARSPRLAGWGELDSLYVSEAFRPPGRRHVADRPGRRLAPAGHADG